MLEAKTIALNKWRKVDVAIKVTKAEKKQTTSLGSRIKPLSCGLAILSVYDDGSVLSPEVFNLMEDDLVDKFATSVSMIASLSSTLSYPTLAAAHHMFVNTYKNVLAVAVVPIASAKNDCCSCLQ
ncbi:60S acidic ribosomal protein P0-like [Asparagus officinalis]|uniref:60S acidic ribosomal protein P0-like n=1 Tax=Asparagus officinalis TaxID=4686 RepID=UPI00098DE75C|nr:60S acidic ribosomal protein P0-like [Asparagus officinalis]